MKILLLNPPVNIDSVYGGMTKVTSNVPPQGLCQMASLTRARHPEADIRILDSQALDMGIKHTVEQIIEYGPDILGFSLYTSKLNLSLTVADELIKAQGGKKSMIIAGGPHATFYGSNLIKTQSHFDLAVVGEGEEALCDIVEASAKGLPIDAVKGLIVRRDGEVVRTEGRSPIEDLDVLPLPAWDLLPDLKQYYRLSGFKVKKDAAGMSIITSRGCPGKCNFCNPRGLGARIRYHSAGYIMKMVRDLYDNFGIRELYVQDDMFTADREHVIDVCDLLVKSGLDIPWTCNLRVDYIDREVLTRMRDAGCWQVSVGIESGSQEILDAINKGTTVKQNLDATYLCRDLGLGVMGLFMVGVFKETKQTLDMTLDFIDKAFLTDIQVTFYTPLPGTASWAQWPKYGTFDVNANATFHVRPTFIPNGFTEKDLIAYQKKLYRKFYLKPRILFRYFKMLFNPRLSRRLFENLLGFLTYMFSSRSDSKKG